MKKETLSDKEKDGEWMYNGSNTTQKCYPKEDIKEHTKNVQRRLKEKISNDYKLLEVNDKDILKEINKIFLEEFGEKIIK